MLICRHVVDYNACCCGPNIAYARGHFAVPPPAGARCAVLALLVVAVAGPLFVSWRCLRPAGNGLAPALWITIAEPLRIRRSVCAYEGSGGWHRCCYRI